MLGFLQIFQIEIIAFHQLILLFFELLTGNSLVGVVLGDEFHCGLELFPDKAPSVFQVLHLRKGLFCGDQLIFISFKVVVLSFRPGIFH